MNVQDWFPLGWTGWISLQSKGLSRVFSNTAVRKHQFFGTQLFWGSNSHIQYMTTGKTIALTRQTFVGKIMSLLFKILSRFVMAFLHAIVYGVAKSKIRLSDFHFHTSLLSLSSLKQWNHGVLQHVFSLCRPYVLGWPSHYFIKKQTHLLNKCGSD